MCMTRIYWFSEVVINRQKTDNIIFSDFFWPKKVIVFVFLFSFVFLMHNFFALDITSIWLYLYLFVFSFVLLICFALESNLDIASQ